MALIKVKQRPPVRFLPSEDKKASNTDTATINTSSNVEKSTCIKIPEPKPKVVSTVKQDDSQSNSDIFDCIEIEEFEGEPFTPKIDIKLKKVKNSKSQASKKIASANSKARNVNVLEKRITRSFSGASSSNVSSGSNSSTCSSFETSPVKKKISKVRPRVVTAKSNLKSKGKRRVQTKAKSIKAKSTTSQIVNRRNKKNSERLERIRTVLKANGTIEPLPGRVEEFNWIKMTILRLLQSSLGGCLYISGVPGTGKTATTHQTLDYLTLSALKGECRDFDFVEINGMRISDPGQAYSILANTILPPSKGKKQKPMSGALALKKLESHFKAQQIESTGRPCIVFLDELDLLLKKKQSILYHFFEWPNWANSRLIVVTIANTMDLPERFLSNRISSRLGLTRYNFKPYEHSALAHIIEHQLKDQVQFLGREAIQLCARKVAAVSGDARRAINLSQRAVDYFRSCSQDELVFRMTGKLPLPSSTLSSSSTSQNLQQQSITAVNLRLMDLVMKDALMANPVQVIGQLAKHQRLMLLSILLARKKVEDEAALRGGTKITGLTSSSTCPTIDRVLEQHFQLCRTHQFLPLPSLQELYGLLSSLEALRLLRVMRFREGGPQGLVQLIVHEEDVRKGLGDDKALKKYTIS